MKRIEFNNYIGSADFRTMFNELGWDNVSRTHFNTTIKIEEEEFEMCAVGGKRGFIIYTCEVEQIPQNTLCRKIDMRLRKYSNDYILIFHKPDSEHHLWIAPIKTVEKREIVTVEYASAEKAEFLFSKLNNLSFGIEEEVQIVDVTSRIHDAFAVNSGQITKQFYAGFKKQHNSFVSFIQGIEVEGDKQWYASVMLNRLMFCYFIQKKGFLNFDTNYLGNKFKVFKEQQNESSFFQSFYKGFLCALFHGGLNHPQHTKDFEKIYGRIPYLNGGMFDEHKLERDYADIDIADDAFEKLFTFFDQWRWHLDTRITASGKDINPDVLGYIFEQYINDRAQMGAYYTKEDITEYIGKNCIIPFLMDEVAKASPKEFKPDGNVWASLKESGDKYIYAAVQKGKEFPLPDYIEEGVDPSKPDLLARRARWNEKTNEELALPTEIWRETVERRNRYFDIKNKIENGEITNINDFITYNLDIRSFVYDLLSKTEDHLFVRHFYASLQKVTILDPTCGSGAFLFAALNILEPLYEICLARMAEFNEKNPNLFKEELAEIENKYRSNIQHFIYKSIILRNLYGVDIMVEATEIAKLRLFLKMVAVVDVDRRAENLGLDPLPDIDFNIRCGNTLVGYANFKELENELDYGGDIFARAEFEEKIRTEMEKVSMTYDRFKEIQLNQQDDIEEFKEAKTDLESRLEKLNDILNKFLYGSGQSQSIEDWKLSHQPFHWISEFYQIIQGNGGFDVIIGNPPYVVYTDRNSTYQISSGYITRTCANLYAYCIERSQVICSVNGRFGMIVPNSSISADKLSPVQKLITEERDCWISNYSWRPSKLFEGADMLLAIIITVRSVTPKVIATRYYKWYNEYRECLFQNLNYNNVSRVYIEGTIPKIPNNLVLELLKKMQNVSNNFKLSNCFRSTVTDYRLFYFRAVQYWFKVLDKEPIYLDDGVQFVTGEMKPLYFNDAEQQSAVISILSSSIFFLNYILWSSCQVVNSRDFNIYFDYKKLSKQNLRQLSKLGDELENDYQYNSHIVERNYSKKGRVFTMQKQHFYIKKSKSIIDKIDKVLAKHYGFTDEELDFIINYDIKYRMGSELDNE